MKKIFVDFDGTLVDSTGCWQEAYRYMCVEKNYLFDKHIFDSFLETSYDEWTKRISSKYNINAADELMKYAIKSYINRKPIQRVIDFLKSSKYEITIVTREDKILVESWLDFYHISFVKDILKLGEEREEQSFYSEKIILIDDSLRYCKPAHKAGAYVIGINDHHSLERQQEMKEICDEYWEAE